MKGGKRRDLQYLVSVLRCSLGPAGLRQTVCPTSLSLFVSPWCKWNVDFLKSFDVGTQ